MRSLEEGSWNDAEDDCRKGSSHLWSINSYDEWWNVYNSLGTLAAGKHQHDVIHSTFQEIPSTILLFIGLRVYRDSAW